MENLVFAILLLGCDHTLERCSYVPAPVEFYASHEECSDILPLAFHEAETYPVAVGECVAVPREWIEKDIVFEWSISDSNGLKVSVVGPDNEVFGDIPETRMARNSVRIEPAG